MMNKMLMEKARSMLIGVEPGQEFWAKAMDIACCLFNISPSLALEDNSPLEVWTGTKPSLSHLRVFGCDAYVHATNEKITKLDSKYERFIFIGEVKDVIKYEVLPKEPEKIELELKEEESDSIKEQESKEEEPHSPVLRRSVREIRQLERYIPSSFYSNFVLSIIDDDTRIDRDAVDLEDGKFWKEAMVEEMTSLYKNEAWDLVELSIRRKLIDNKWMFNKKKNAKGKVEKYKSRLVEKGYS
eukprot:PITA_07510